MNIERIKRGIELEIEYSSGLVLDFNQCSDQLDGTNNYLIFSELFLPEMYTSSVVNCMSLITLYALQLVRTQDTIPLKLTPAVLNPIIAAFDPAVSPEAVMSDNATSSPSSMLYTPVVYTPYTSDPASVSEEQETASGNSYKPYY